MNDCLEHPYSVYLKDKLTAGLEITPGQNPSFFMAEGFHGLCAAKGDPWRALLRYQAQAERNHRRALEEFERIKNLRNELPNEAISMWNPKKTQPVPIQKSPQKKPSRRPYGTLFRI